MVMDVDNDDDDGVVT